MALFLPAAILILCPTADSADSETAPQILDATILRETLERPLQIELLKSGLTPRNAAAASQNMLNSLIECWKSEQNSLNVSEQDTIVVQIGGETIVTYESRCMSDFLADVDLVAR